MYSIHYIEYREVCYIWNVTYFTCIYCEVIRYIEHCEVVYLHYIKYVTYEM